jgi:acyl carrier protein
MSSLPPQHLEILQRLKQIVIGRVPVDPAQLSPEANLEEVGIDSFSLVELVFLAEEEFNIKIPVEGLSVKTVGDILHVIANGVGPARAY